MPSLFFRARTGLARLIAPRQPARRAFNAAQVSRTTSDWITGATSADAEIRSSFRRLLDRSRDLERNNDYMRGFLTACERNILGAHKYDLRSDAGEYVTKKTGGKSVTEWQPDDMAKRMIEEAWTDWGKKKNCTVNRSYSWRNVKRLSVRSLVRDGNVLIRKIRGPAARNKYNYALQLWEIDHLETDRFEIGTRNRNEIRFGIEYDASGAVVAYWLRARHPGDYLGTGSAGDGYRTTRIPADDVYHLALPDRPEQTLSVPWVVAAITRLRQLGAFEEAAVVAARLGASNAVFFETNGEGQWTGDTDSDGQAVMDIEPGVAQQLPQGWKASPYTPHYPNIQTGDFRKAMLRGISSSLGLSYTTMGNDLESVNFSSARVGLFDEREGWKALQIFFSEELWELIFTDWLESSMAAGAINLPLAKFAKFDRPIFKARRWPFIDPAKEIEAAKTGIALRTTSRRQVIEEQGGDVEEVFLDNRDDEALAEKLGVDLAPDDQPPAPAPAEPDDDDAQAARSLEIIRAKETADAQARHVEVLAALARQQPPTVTINQPPITVEPSKAEVRVENQPAKVEVNVPQQREAAVVVNVPTQPAPVVQIENNVTVPRQNATLTVSRDAEGKLKDATIVQKP